MVKQIGGPAVAQYPELANALVPFIRDFAKAGIDLGLDKDPEKARAAARRATDYALRRLDIENIPRQPEPGWYGVNAPEKPFDVLRDVLRALRAGATVRLAADPDYAAKTSFMAKINARRATEGLPAYQVRRPADFGQLAVDEYLTVLDEERLRDLVGPEDKKFADVPIYKALRTVFRELDALSLPAALATDTRPDGTRVAGSNDDNMDRMNVAVTSILHETLSKLLLMAPEEHEEMRARLKELPPTP